jgi:preprotein translocase subunit SecF
MAFPLVRHIPVQTDIPFMRVRFLAFIVSLFLILGSVGAFFGIGLNFGIDFRGGTLIEITTEQEPDLGEIREALNGLGLGDVQVQDFGGVNSVLIRVATVTPDQVLAYEGVPADVDAEAAQQIARQQVQAVLSDLYPGVTYERVEVVGPQVSGELIVAGTTAVVIALFLMLVYIWLRFEWQYSVGAVLALSHDVIATIGFFALTQKEFNLPTIAAILTIVGYSMNDTVVVYDRIREMFRKYKTMPTPDVLNIAINATLSRTLMTSGTTLIALFALAFLGGPALESFAWALIWGVGIGTYSSIFVAAPLLTVTGVKRGSDDDEKKA